MSNEEWWGLILESLAKMSDRSYQERSWLGLGPEVSSPTEMVINLFDDLNIEGFMELYESQFECLVHVRGFISFLDESDITDCNIDGLLDGDLWVEIRRRAATVLAAVGGADSR